MKVFKKVLFILLALSMVCCFVGCPDPNNGPDPDDGSDVVIDGDDSGNEGGNVEGDTPVTPPAGDEGGDVEGDTPATTVTVDATWSFATQPEGMPLSDGADVAPTALVLAPASGAGATLTATGRMKWADGGYIQAQASSNVTSEGALDCNKWLELTLSADATVTIICQGAGAQDPKRYVAIVGNEEILEKTDVAGIASGSDITITKALKAGTYKIMFNGSRIYSITCN